MLKEGSHTMLEYCRPARKFKQKAKNMKVINSISNLNISLDELYEGKKQLIIKLSDKPYQFHVVIAGRDGRPDCKISSFSANLWARTKKGINCEKYRSLKTLQASLVRLVKSKVDTNGNISFELTSNVCNI